MSADAAAGHQTDHNQETASSWLSEFFDNLQQASDEALDIFYSAFNVSQSPANTQSQGLGWGSVNKEGEGRKQFYFGDPSDYDLSEINGPRSQWSLFKSNLKGFVQAIEWTEPWLIALGCLHVCLLITAVATRSNNTAQIVLFVVIMASVYLAERLNTLAAANWERFATQNYFDKQGVFISTMWSMPLLLIGVVMLFQSLYSASSLLVQVKRRQLRQQIRESKKEREEAPASGAAETKKSQ